MSSHTPPTELSESDRAALPSDGGARFNRLIFEKSPYLLQHAENAVDWHPWADEAFDRARKEDKPIFLSIGYSTCHWCHVMEEESFDNDAVAFVLNRAFIPIKVDREERPDIDASFMTVCQMLTGSGGWPLNLALTPEKKPFFAATYIPREPRQGMAGLIQILEKIEQTWARQRQSIVESGDQIAQVAHQIMAGDSPGQALDEHPLKQVLDDYRSAYDSRHCGFGQAPKFPAPHNLSLLLRLGGQQDGSQAVDMALETLRAIRSGGIYDQVGFGLHRYSVDAEWLVPHFEKMLYDQALLVLAAVDAWQISGDRCFREMALQTLDYVIRDLTDPQGGMYCGEDADSEGEEGTFYLWTRQQVMEVLGDDLGTVYCRSFGVSEEGNFEGKSILFLPQNIESLADRVGVEAAHLKELLEQGRQRLFLARQRRIRPHRDQKVITSWNGLAIAALARAGAVFGKAELLDAARNAARFIQTHLRNDQGRLLRRWCDGEAAIAGFLEDYAFLSWGLIELYQADLRTGHLSDALHWTRQMLELFGGERGAFYTTGKDAEAVLGRDSSLQDGAIPAGGSVAALNLLRLGRMTGNRELEQRGEEQIESTMEALAKAPRAYPQQLTALHQALAPPVEVVLVPGADGESPEALLGILRSHYLPTATVLLADPCDKELQRLAPATLGKHPVNGKAAAYVCVNRSCREPVTEPAELDDLLKSLTT